MTLNLDDYKNLDEVLSINATDEQRVNDAIKNIRVSKE